MFYTYILQSLKDGKTYTGYTFNVEQRLCKHNNGQVKATRYRRPFKILFTEEFESEQEAKKRELYWKSGAGRRKLKNILKN
jgi:putative endonuclease